MIPPAERRICALCGQPFAILIPEGAKDDVERDRLCGECVSLPPPPEEPTEEHMNDTALLYALSTLAQTCAALAAFVGAVGIFRLQILRDQRRETERDMRRLVAHPAVYGPEVAERLPLQHIVERIREAVIRGDLPLQSLAQRALGNWRSLEDRRQQSTQGLLILEAWNLFVIGVALIGFNYLPWLVSSPGVTFYVLWAVALGTVGVTGYSVFMWTRGE